MLSIKAVAFDPDDIEGAIVGFDSFYIDSDNADAKRRVKDQQFIFYRMAYYISFFTRYVAVFPAAVREAGTGIHIGALFETGRTNIDIAFVSTSAKTGRPAVELLERTIPLGSPTPDCRKLPHWARILHYVAPQSANTRR